MFGFVIANGDALSDGDMRKYRAAYCGLCRAIRRRHGSLSALSLNYDMTFLVLMLSSVYEDEGEFGEERCCVHPRKKHEYWHSSFTDYAADMTAALAYHSCMDNWTDDKNPASLALAGILKRPYRSAAHARVTQCAVIEQCLEEISRAEQRRDSSPDVCANSFGRLMGELFAGTGGIWSERLRAFGESLGRFVYIMDACVDYRSDVKHGRYNPLALSFGENADDEELRNILNMLIGECALDFERLPIIRDLDLMRNIIYSGVWLRYDIEQRRRGGKNV